jgi:hypothetical protein
MERRSLNLKDTRKVSVFGTWGRRVDWGQTNKLKAELLSKGVSLYNKETNPTGTQYFIYKTNSHVNWFSWIKRPFLPNTSLYSIIFPRHNNTGKYTDELLASLTCKDDIFKIDQVGNLVKLELLEKYDSTHSNKFIRL